MWYEKKHAFIVDNKVNLPDKAIVLKKGLIFSKPILDPDCALVDGITYLVPIEEEKHG